MMAVDLTRDNKELAQAYDVLSNAQFNKGCTLLGKLGVKADDTVLDIGCGTGRLGRYTMGLIGAGGHYIGLEPLVERLGIAKEKNECVNADFHSGVAEDLGRIADDSVDVVVLNSVFHWVPDKEKALSEIRRVLQPGGKVGITTAAKELSVARGDYRIMDEVLRQERYAGKVCWEQDPRRQHKLTVTELIRLLLQAQLVVEDVQVLRNKRTFTTARDMVLCSEASSFGNYLTHVSAELRPAVKAEMIAAIEKIGRQNGRIEFDSYTAFAVAQKCA